MQYEAPTTINAAVKLLAGKARTPRVLGGGTDLLVQMRTGRIEPDLLVDVKRIPGMRDIAAKAGGFRIGAAVSGSELGEHKALKKAWPGVVAVFTLFSNDTTSKEYQGVMNMLRDSVEEVFAPQKP